MSGMKYPSTGTYAAAFLRDHFRRFRNYQPSERMLAVIVVVAMVMMWLLTLGFNLGIFKFQH